MTDWQKAAPDLYAQLRAIADLEYAQWLSKRGFEDTTERSQAFGFAFARGAKHILEAKGLAQWAEAAVSDGEEVETTTDVTTASEQ
jgi:hypothetical protein